MWENQIREDISNILDSQKLGVLATYDREYPYTNIVGFAATEDLNYILFATFRNTHKYENIEAKSNVSMLIDTRTNRVDDFSNAQALTVLGDAKEIYGDVKMEYANLYLRKHPNLEEFISDSNCALIGIKVKKYILVSRFQEVVELGI